MIMKAIGYVRVSTEEQAKGGVSLDMQRSKIRKYASLEEMELVDIIADEGISGCSIKIRPGVQRVLRMIREKQVDAVIIYKLDRLARNTVEALEIAKLMDRKGIALHSITEKLDTKSALGRFFFTLMASLAEMERGIISERISAAMERKREKLEPCNNNPTYGYRIDEWQVVPDQEEQKIIERIFSLRDEGTTIHGIIDILSREGVLNRRGKPFGKTQIHNIIQRRAA
jgi:DNA invertase Pin-like site-specific DNA recombinase